MGFAGPRNTGGQWRFWRLFLNLNLSLCLDYKIKLMCADQPKRLGCGWLWPFHPCVSAMQLGSIQLCYARSATQCHIFLGKHSGNGHHGGQWIQQRHCKPLPIFGAHGAHPTCSLHYAQRILSPTWWNGFHQWLGFLNVTGLALQLRRVLALWGKTVLDRPIIMFPSMLLN